MIIKFDLIHENLLFHLEEVLGDASENLVEIEEIINHMIKKFDEQKNKIIGLHSDLIVENAEHSSINDKKLFDYAKSFLEVATFMNDSVNEIKMEWDEKKNKFNNELRDSVDKLLVQEIANTHDLISQITKNFPLTVEKTNVNYDFN